MIVTLLTDFGLADHYVAAMKGVILSHDARIVVVDISHEVPAYDRSYAAFLLAACHGAFPSGTVHVAIVDPGVGSARRPLAIQARGSYFVGPDNGIFPPSVSGAPDLQIVAIDPRAVRKDEPSATFHGRDIFAPAAAALATGTLLRSLGAPVSDMIELDRPAPKLLAGGILEGRLIHVDRFGNCVMSFRPRDFPGDDWRSYAFHAGGFRIDLKAHHYEAGHETEPFVLQGSTGFLEIAVKRGSAADRLGVSPRDEVRAEPSAATRASKVDPLT